MITTEFRQKVREAILIDRSNYTDLSDAKYAKTIGVSGPIFNRLKKGETEKIAAPTFWIEQGRKLNISLNQRKWNVARTSVYESIEENILFCKQYNKATILADECGIGKTFCTKHILRNLPNTFYIDCSQAKTKSQFIRRLATVLGIDSTGKLFDVKENIKYFINLIESPFIALDDAGYLESNVLIEIIGLWNATEGQCGWLMIGDDSLQNKIEKGLNNKKPGYKALFSRFSEEYISFVPTGIDNQHKFFTQLIGDVAHVNTKNKTSINKYIKKCIGRNENGERKSLRHLDTLIKLER